MARIRTIKPEFFTSEDIMDLSPLARLLYIALWCEADKEGRFSWKPKAFKVRYLPSDECDVEAICSELEAARLVIIYGDGLAVIPSFKSHQHINPREKDSAFPAPSAEDLTRQPRVSDASVTRREEGRKEGREWKEGKGTSPAQAPDAPPPESAEKRKKRRGTEEDEKAARWMFGLVLAVNATAKQPNWPVWADEVRLMREIDGRTHKQICELFQWAKHDSFWCANIQSPSKLREKWDTLTEQRARGSGRSSQGEKFNFSGIDRSGDKLAQAASMEKHGITIPDGEVEL
jgi:hypothetical protein